MEMEIFLNEISSRDGIVLLGSRKDEKASFSLNIGCKCRTFLESISIVRGIIAELHRSGHRAD